jgi:hypothetical protein
MFASDTLADVETRRRRQKGKGTMIYHTTIDYDLPITLHLEVELTPTETGMLAEGVRLVRAEVEVGGQTVALELPGALVRDLESDILENDGADFAESFGWERD